MGICTPEAVDLDVITQKQDQGTASEARPRLIVSALRLQSWKLTVHLTSDTYRQP